ncbi:MAG: DUF2782 domain-containing protein [Pseudomonadota bacterium]|nr:DUF2782 domain-containing protein [Pseudomonadota bacterium]
MRTYAFLLTALFTLPAYAAKPGLVPLPDIPPPPGMVDPSLEPQITIVQRGNERVEEFRIKGKLYMIRITPPHGRSYYLVDQRGDGAMRRYDDLSPNFQVPMWVIGEF